MKNKKIIKIGLILVLVLSSFFVWKKFKNKSGKERFKTVTVEKGSIKISVQATGTTMPQNRLELKPPISGRIDSINVQEGQKIKKGEVLAWLSSTERAALLDAARAKGQKELDYWEDAYKPTPLVSPMDGVIIARNMEPGQTVTTQEAPLVMSDRLVVKAQVDETDIGQLQIGQKSEIVLDAYPNTRIQGMINHIAYESKTVNNVTMYEVEVLPQRVPPFMRAGMSANLTFVIQEKENILLLPQEAVRTGENGSRVLIPSAEGEKKERKRESKEIQTGLSDGKKVEVTDGLSEGETVLVPEMKWDKTGQKSGGTSPFMPGGGRRPGSGGGNSGGGGRESRSGTGGGGGR